MYVLLPTIWSIRMIISKSPILCPLQRKVTIPKFAHIRIWAQFLLLSYLGFYLILLGVKRAFQILLVHIFQTPNEWTVSVLKIDLRLSWIDTVPSRQELEGSVAKPMLPALHLGVCLGVCWTLTLNEFQVAYKVAEEDFVLTCLKLQLPKGKLPMVELLQVWQTSENCTAKQVSYI